MVDTGYKKATNKIVVAGTPFVTEKEIETATTMYPGRLVKRGTTDNEVKVNTSDALAYGWLGYEDTPVMFRPANKSTIYSAADRAAILAGPIIIEACLASGQTIIMGDKLISAAAGELTKAALAGGSAEMVVAIAAESVDASGAAKKILVRSKI